MPYAKLLRRIQLSHSVNNIKRSKVTNRQSPTGADFVLYSLDTNWHVDASATLAFLPTASNLSQRLFQYTSTLHSTVYNSVKAYLVTMTRA